MSRRVFRSAALVVLSVISAASVALANAGEPEVHRLAVTASGHLLVGANANGHPIRLVVDTACPVTIIDSAVYPELARPGASAAEVGRTLYPKSFGYRAAASGSIADLRIGGTLLGRVAVGVTSLETVLGSGVTRSGHTDAEGILGSDVLLRRRAIMDLKSGTLLLDPDPHQKEALAARAAREGYTTVPMAPTNGWHEAVPCVLSGDPYRLVVDTGSPGTVVQRALLGSSDLVRPMRVSYMKTLGGSSTVAWLPLQNWNIGDFPVGSATVATGDFHGGIFTERTSNSGQVAGQLGLDLLSHWRALVDFGARKLYLKRRESQTPPITTQNFTRGTAPQPSSIVASTLQQPRQAKTR